MEKAVAAVEEGTSSSPRVAPTILDRLDKNEEKLDKLIAMQEEM
jgi:hypothetical protein